MNDWTYALCVTLGVLVVATAVVVLSTVVVTVLGGDGG